jgi:hypothetical protein
VNVVAKNLKQTTNVLKNIVLELVLMSLKAKCTLARRRASVSLVVKPLKDLQVILPEI